MNKQDLITAMSEKSGLTKKVSEAALNAFVSSVEEALGKGEKVQLVGFGGFEVRERAERMVKNPANGEPITIPAGKSPVFKAGKALKDAVK